jgi:hypothetical protein
MHHKPRDMGMDLLRYNDIRAMRRSLFLHLPLLLVQMQLYRNLVPAGSHHAFCIAALDI